jgi:hypothetical protein
MTLPARGQLTAQADANALNIIKDSTAKLTTASGQRSSTLPASYLRPAAAVFRSPWREPDESPAPGGREGRLWPILDGLERAYKPVIVRHNAALQGYQPAKPGEAQGPYGFQPDTRRTRQAQRSARRQLRACRLRCCRSKAMSVKPPYFGGPLSTLQQLSPLTAPPAVPPSWGQPPPPAPHRYTR